MAHVEQDSELFTNVVSATAIPAGTTFTAFKDVNGSPAVLSLGDDGTLNLFVQTAGKLVNFDFAEACKVSGVVTAFALRQRSDSSVFIVFSVEENNQNRVIVLPNLPVNGIATPPVSTIIKSDIKLSKIHGIYIYTRKDREGIAITGDLLKPGLKDLHVAQHGLAVTMWFTNTEDAAGYYHATSDFAITNGSMVSLLTPGKGGRLSGMITATSLADKIDLVNTLVSVDEQSNLTSLQQSSANGAWDAYPLMMSTKVKNFDVPSYTTRIRVMSSANTAAVNSTFTLTSTGRVSAIVNGVNTILEAGGLVVHTDASGEATFIIATSDISSHTFEISTIMDALGTRLEIPSVEVNPAAKAQQILQSIQSGDDLRNAKTQTGKALVDQDVVKQEDIDHAGETMAKISDHMKTLASTRSIIQSRSRANPRSASSNAFTPGEFWTWATSKVHEAETWVVDEIEEGVQFVITIAGEVWNFILDTVDAVGKAFTWIVEKLKVAFSTLIDFLGFLFAWDDIVNAKDSLSAFLTTGLEWGAEKVDVVIPKVDQLFADITKWIGEPKTDKDVEPIDQGSSSDQTRQKSMGYNWSKYHLVHGGGAENFKTGEVPANPGPMEDLWNDLILPTVQDLQKDIEKIGDDAVNLFKNSDTSVSVQQSLKLVAEDVAITFVDVIKNIVEGVLKLMRDLLRWISDVGNATIDIPVFSALWRKISGGHELTAFDAICLVLAVPATIACKAITGKALPDIKEMMQQRGPALIQQYVDQTGAPKEMSDINTVAAFGCLSGTFIGAALSVVGFIMDDVAVTGKMPIRAHYAMKGDPVIRTTKAMWGMMAGRNAVALLAYGVNPGNQIWKNVIAGFNAITGAVQLGLQIDVAVKAGGGSELEGRRIAIASCYMVGTLCKTIATFFRGNPEEATPPQILYWLFALCSAGLQVWNVREASQKGFPWDPVPTVL
ncbi:hypothetical protein P7C71_g1975, partial [Lecanoromycetidae sp. Uapishka_2]